MVGAAAIIYTFLWVSIPHLPSYPLCRSSANIPQYWFSKLNSSRERGEENAKIVGLSEEDIAELGDES